MTNIFISDTTEFNILCSYSNKLNWMWAGSMEALEDYMPNRFPIIIREDEGMIRYRIPSINGIEGIGEILTIVKFLKQFTSPAVNLFLD